MNFSPRVLGKHTAALLQARIDTPVLIVGSDFFTRRDLSSLDCFNFVAAANLSRILADFGVINTRDVYERISPLDLAVPRLGAISLAVLGAAFEAKKLGGDRPLETWVTKHRAAGPRREFVTFDTLKDRYQQRHSTKRAAPRSRSRRLHSVNKGRAWHHRMATATAADGTRGRRSKN